MQLKGKWKFISYFWQGDPACLVKELTDAVSIPKFLSSCVCTHLAWRNGSTWGLLKTISYKKEVRIAALDFKRSTKWRNKCLWTNHVEVNSFPFHYFLFCVSSSLMAGWFDRGEGCTRAPKFLDHSKQEDRYRASYFHKGLICQNGEIELYTSN